MEKEGRGISRRKEWGGRYSLKMKILATVLLSCLLCAVGKPTSPWKVSPQTKYHPIKHLLK